MGLIKKKGGGALSRLRKQKDIHDKLASGEARSADTQEALVLLLDMSPSMLLHEDSALMDQNDTSRYRTQGGRRAWDAAVRATRALVDASTMSKIGLVAFCAMAPLERRLAIGADMRTMMQWLSRWDPRMGNGTDFTSALNAGLDMLKNYESAPVRRMILMTDGCDGRHSGSLAAEEAERRLQRSGVILDTVGFGDVNPEELQRLADLGGGTYHHSATGAALVKTFKQLEAGVRGLLGSGI